MLYAAMFVSQPGPKVANLHTCQVRIIRQEKADQRLDIDG